MKNNKVSFVSVIKAAGITVASVIGSGFATGQELMQFFSSFGISGIFGIAVSTFIFSFTAAVYMKNGYEHKLDSHDKIVNFYFGKSGKVIDSILELFTFCVYVIVLAGIGALTQECLGISPLFGRFFCGLYVIVYVLSGADKLYSFVGFLGIIIIVSTLAVGLYGALTGPNTLSFADSFLCDTEVLKSANSWLVSGILYPSFNIVFVFFITGNSGSKASSSLESIIGGILGGLLVGFGIYLIDIGFLKNISSVYNVSIPSIVLASEIGVFAKYIFTTIIFVGICTCAGPTMWNVVKFISPGNDKRKDALIIVILSVVSQILAVTDFKILVNTIYPFSGYFGILFILWTVFLCFFDYRR